MADVIVVIGPGLIGQAIARRVGVGKRVLLADAREQNAIAAAEIRGNAGDDVIVTTVDVSSRESVHALAEEAAALGDVTGLIHAVLGFPVANVARDGAEGRPVRHGARARGVGT